MRLFLPSCRSCNSKFYLTSSYPTRSAFREQHGNHFSATCANCNTTSNYTVNEIQAETGAAVAPAGGVVIGGLIGLLGGPIGIIIGAILGGSVGTGVAVAEDSEVTQFNKS